MFVKNGNAGIVLSGYSFRFKNHVKSVNYDPKKASPRFAEALATYPDLKYWLAIPISLTDIRHEKEYEEKYTKKYGFCDPRIGYNKACGTKASDHAETREEMRSQKAKSNSKRAENGGQKGETSTGLPMYVSIKSDSRKIQRGYRYAVSGNGNIKVLPDKKPSGSSATSEKTMQENLRTICELLGDAIGKNIPVPQLDDNNQVMFDNDGNVIYLN
jgi:hypothetical protein